MNTLNTIRYILIFIPIIIIAILGLWALLLKIISKITNKSFDHLIIQKFW